ncbi:MAG: hypothetical protein ACYC9S_08460 [Leptospirales bacterium]
MSSLNQHFLPFPENRSKNRTPCSMIIRIIGLTPSIPDTVLRRRFLILLLPLYGTDNHQPTRFFREFHKNS